MAHTKHHRRGGIPGGGQQLCSAWSAERRDVYRAALHNTTALSSPARRVAVTDGRRTLGTVVHRDDGFEAIAVTSHTIGIYRSEPDAASALWRWSVQHAGEQ
jgi:hypothetical protein